VKAKLTPIQSALVKRYITEDDIKAIAAKVDLSERMVKFIRDGKWPDKHGVIDMMMAIVEIRKQAELNRNRVLSEIRRQQRLVNR
jgi:hypothetical protein